MAASHSLFVKVAEYFGPTNFATLLPVTGLIKFVAHSECQTPARNTRRSPMVKIFIDDTDNNGGLSQVREPQTTRFNSVQPMFPSTFSECVQVLPNHLFKPTDVGSVGLENIEGSRTYDTLRYGKTDSNLPFKFSFTDKTNVKWVVEVDKEDDNVHFMIPCGTQMLWYGADESPTRTGSDSMTDWASVGFSWQDKTWLPPYHGGVRIEFQAYKAKNHTEWEVNTKRWTKVLDLAKKGAKPNKD